VYSCTVLCSFILGARLCVLHGAVLQAVCAGGLRSNISGSVLPLHAVSVCVSGCVVQGWG
jgi:hypothetical protein